MAKLADAHALGACDRKVVQVQLLSRAQICYHYFMSILLSLLLLAYSLIHPLSAHAQAINQGNQYRSAYSEYVRSKNQHIQYGTAATRQDAISKTAAVLEARNNWQLAYMRHLRQLLADTTNIANYSQTVIYLRMETQIANLASRANTYSNMDSFTKINTASKSWEADLAQTDPLIMAAQLQVASGKLARLQSNFSAKIQDILTTIGTPSASQQSTLDLIQTKYDSSVEILSEVDKKLTVFGSNTFSKFGLIENLNKSKTNLQDAAKLLIELSFQLPK